MQKNASSVQQELEEKMSILFKETVKLTGCGRTDTGVHALRYFAHFDINNLIGQPQDLVGRLNTFLPEDIVIFGMASVEDGFNARFDALSRTYNYNIHTKKNPFINESSWFLKNPGNRDLLTGYAEVINQYQHFQSFCKSRSQNKTDICHVHKSAWKIQDEKLIYEVKANRFLRNMVRALVGTMVQCAQNELSVKEFEKIIEAKDRRKAGLSAPAEGLFLMDVEYPEGKLTYLNG